MINMLDQNLKIILDHYPQAEEKLKFFLDMDIESIKSDYESNSGKIDSLNSNLIHNIDRLLLSQITNTKETPFYTQIKNIVGKEIHQEIERIIRLTKLQYLNIQTLCNSLVSQITYTIMKDLEKVLVLDEMIAEKSEIKYQPDWKRIKENHCVAVNQFYHTLSHLIEVLKWTVKSLEKDETKLAKILCKKQLIIQKVVLNLGDMHQFGRAVVRVSTPELNFILKPRNAQSEEILRQVSSIVNRETSGKMIIGFPKTFNSDHHCWHEDIQYEECTSKEEVYQFYYNIGGLICLMYALNGTDFHFENIIAQGNIPFVVDTECMFDKLSIRENILENSVISSYITPPLVGKELDRQICGIGIKSKKGKFIVNQEFKKNIAGKYEKKNSWSIIPNYYNRPNFSKEVCQDTIKSNILSGFESTWQILKKNDIKNEIVEIINQYKSVEVRKLYRGTREYDSILKLSNHPRYLSNPYDKKIILACTLYLKKIDDHILQHEFQAIIKGFIPYFTEELSTKDLISRINSSIHRLDFEQEFELQKNILHMSLERLFPTQNNNISIKQPLPIEIDTIIDNIFSKAIPYGNSSILLNSMNFKDKSKFLKSMDSSIYNGTGSLLFLKICCAIATRRISQRKQEITDLFFKLYREEMEKKNSSFGVFDGRGSLLYLAYLIYNSIDKSIDKEFQQILDSILEKIEQEDSVEVDIISGISGILIICYRMAKSNKMDTSLNSTIRYLTNKILSERVIDPLGTTWNKKFTGFSHGNSGVIYSLTLANEILRDPKLSMVIEDGLAFERNHKIETGWRDLRYADSTTDFNAWCHGAQGIVLARKAMLAEGKLLSNESKRLIQNDIEHYQNTTPKRASPSGFSLCHGVITEWFIQGNHGKIKKLLKENIFDYHDISEDKTIMTGKLGIYYVLLLMEDPSVPNILLIK